MPAATSACRSTPGSTKPRRDLRLLPFSAECSEVGTRRLYCAGHVIIAVEHAMEGDVELLPTGLGVKTEVDLAVLYGADEVVIAKRGRRIPAADGITFLLER